VPVIAIPVVVTARDEARAIGACLDSLLAAARVAEARHPVRLELVVALDDCRDATAEIAASRGVRCLACTGGKVEAQRAGLSEAPFHIFSDADIAVAPDTLAALCAVMLAEPHVEVAFPPKSPLPPHSSSALARALHVYNARRGFSAQRTWFSGKLFAIRRWEIPDAREIARRACALPASRFYDLAAPLRVDDIYLSRRVVSEHGPRALRETDAGEVRFRAPETWVGMYRYYRRMRRELERIDALFPESRHAFGTRRADLAGASPAERRAWRVFQLALAGCRVAYRAERLACDRLGFAPGDPWPAIPETKLP
jgi:glycosyltransferase involved in cell wall biosynthesis